MTVEDMGTLVQRCVLPEAAGMDAMEARVVMVQDVPPKGELRFYAVRGEDRQQLTQEEATKTLRDFVPQRPVTELSDVELLVEVCALRSETARLRPVYEAAKKWRIEHNDNHNCCDATSNLYAAVDEAVATEVK